MKKTLLISTGLIFTAGILVYQGTQNYVYSSFGGSMEGYAGAPSDNSNTCVTCHSGPAAAVLPSIITSDIPSTGYVPGTTYNITATITRPGHTYFGFQITPQNQSGTLMGTLINSSNGSTKFVGANNKYITHTSGGVNANGPTKTWTFGWKAPGQGAGKVTFYGAFLAADKDYSPSGDTTFTSTLVVNEGSVGIVATENSKSQLMVFPNPASDMFTVNYAVEQSGPVEIKLIDILGKTTVQLLQETRNPGSFSQSFILSDDMAKGIYFVKISTGEKSIMQKIIIQ